MRYLATFVLIILLALPAYALEYEKKPNIAVSFVGSNYLHRGDQKTITLVVFNNATREKVKYDDVYEANFFSQNENMLFTAYDVKFELEGNEYIKVKTPTQSVPALPPMQPITLNFIVKVSDDAKAGKYELNLKVKFKRIWDLEKLEVYTNPQNPSESLILPEQVQKQIVNNAETGNGTKIYVYKQLLKQYEVDYSKKTKYIPIEVYVEEKGVTLKIVDVKSENIIGRGKGKITVTIKNVGEKIAKNAYLVLDTPSGIKAQALSFTQTSVQALPMQGTPITGMMPMSMMSGTSMPTMSSMLATGMMPQSLAAAKAAYYIGDLKPRKIANATFYLKLNVKDEGNYPLHIKAVYLDEYDRLTESESVSFGIHVAAAPSFDFLKVDSRVFVNTKGDVVVTLIPTMDLNDVSVYLTTKPPLSVLSSEYYLGNIKAGKEYTAIFKVQASDEAKPVTYPAEIKLKYRSMDEYFYTDPKSIGIKVNPKMKFEVYGTPKIAAGSEKMVTFTIKNVGNFTIREATARLTITDPFSSDDDTAYIGTLKPRQAAEIKFKLSVDADATPKKYGLNLEVKYKDLEDEWAISEPTKAVIEVTPPQPPYGTIAFIIIIAIVAVAYYLRRRKK